MKISVGGVIEIQTAITKDCGSVHGVQSFIKGHINSGVISINASRDITHRISPLTVE